MANHIRTQRHSRSFGAILKSKNVSFRKVDISWLNTMNTNVGCAYYYEAQGLNRVVYEVSHVLPPDDYIMVSAMFDGEASKEQIKKALNE